MSTVALRAKAAKEKRIVLTGDLKRAVRVVVNAARHNANGHERCAEILAACLTVEKSIKEAQ